MNEADQAKMDAHATLAERVAFDTLVLVTVEALTLAQWIKGT